jgi:hypothetical protein
MSFEKRIDLVGGRKSALLRSLETAVDTPKFDRRRVVRANAELRIDLERKLGKFDLSRFRPCLYALQNVLEFLCCHV